MTMFGTPKDVKDERNYLRANCVHCDLSKVLSTNNLKSQQQYMNDKIELCCTSLEHHGYRLTREGIQADPEKNPSNSSDVKVHRSTAVQTMNGMVSNLSRFQTNLTNVMKPLRNSKHKRWNGVGVRSGRKLLIKFNILYAKH